MQLNEILVSIIVIGIATVFPHMGYIPNFGYSIPIILLIWLYLKYFGEKFTDIGFSFKCINLKSIVFGFLSAAIILAMMQLVFFPALEKVIQFEDASFELYNFLKKSKWNYFFLLVMAWVVGGFYEEIVFHGFIFTRFEKMIKGKYATLLSYIFTSIIFGIYHIQMGPLGTINALIVGMVYLSLFLYFKRNLWYSIFCHGFYNSIVITLIYFNYL